MRSVSVIFLLFAISVSAQTPDRMSKAVTTPVWPLEFDRISSPLGERILSVVGTDDGVLLAGTEGNGIVRSTDGGDSWRNTSLREGDIWPMYTAPGGTLYAFVTDGWVSDRSVFSSSDGGEYWSELPDSLSAYFGWAVLAMHGNNMYAEGGGGLHVSSDDGRSWTTLQSEPPMERCQRDYNLEVLSDSVLFAQCLQGLFRSSDGGQSWKRVSLPLAYLWSMEADPAGGVIVTGTDTSKPHGPDDVIRVDYKGSHVEYLSPGPFLGGYRKGIVLNSGILLAGEISWSERILRSVDSGRTWEMTSAVRSGVSDFWQAPDGTVFAAAHGGLLRSTDDGITWKDCAAGTRRRTVWHIYSEKNETRFNETIFIGAGEGGLFVSDDDCASWSNVDMGYCIVFAGFSLAPGHAIVGVKATKPDMVYQPWGKVYLDPWGLRHTIDVTCDHGETWRQLDSLMFYPDCLRRGTDTTVLTNDRYVNVSTDGGKTWDLDSMLISARDIAAIDAGIYVLHASDSLYYRETGQSEWKYLRATQRGRALYADALFLLLLDDAGIHRSIDDGRTWKTTPLDMVRLYDSKFVALGTGTIGLTGCGDVMLLSTNFGSTWNRIVPNKDKRLSVNCVHKDRSGRLLLGTSDGLYRSRGSLRLSRLVHSFQLGVPYPNPATSPVIIPYTLEEAGHVRLTIHDISGRERGVLHEGHHGPGTYYQGLHHTHGHMYGGAGLYFINLSVNGEVQTQPLVFPFND